MLFVVFAPSSLSFGFFTFNRCGVIEFANEVARFVIGVLAEGLLVFRCNYATFSSLFNRLADPSTLKVKINDLHPKLFARCDYLFWKFDVVC